MTQKQELISALELTMQVAESWIHDQLDGTSMLDRELAALEPARIALTKAKGGK